MAPAMAPRLAHPAQQIVELASKEAARNKVEAELAAYLAAVMLLKERKLFRPKRP